MDNAGIMNSAAKGRGTWICLTLLLVTFGGLPSTDSGTCAHAADPTRPVRSQADTRPVRVDSLERRDSRSTFVVQGQKQRVVSFVFGSRSPNEAADANPAGKQPAPTHSILTDSDAPMPETNHAPSPPAVGMASKPVKSSPRRSEVPIAIPAPQEVGTQPTASDALLSSESILTVSPLQEIWAQQDASAAKAQSLSLNESDSDSQEHASEPDGDLLLLEHQTEQEHELAGPSVLVQTQDAVQPSLEFGPMEVESAVPGQSPELLPVPTEEQSEPEASVTRQNPFELLRGSLPEVPPEAFSPSDRPLNNQRQLPGVQDPTLQDSMFQSPRLQDPTLQNSGLQDPLPQGLLPLNNAQLKEPALPLRQQPIPQSKNPIWVAKIKFPALRYLKQTELSLEEAIYNALQFSPEIEILRTEVGIREAEIVRQQATFNWNTFLESSWDERSVPVGSDLEGVTNRLVNHRLANRFGGLKRNELGGNLRLAQELGIEDSNSQFFNPQNQGTARLAVEYEQPLLQGAGRLVNTSLINIAIADASASQEELIAGLQTHILDVVTAYWELVARRGEFVIQKELYEQALETAAIISNRVHLDINPVQSARSEARLGGRRTEMMQAEYAVVFAQEKLLRLIFGPLFPQSVNAEIIPSSEMLGPLRDVNMELETQSALQNRPEIRRSIQFIRRSSVQQGVAKNQLLPALGLVLSLSNQGLRGDRALGGAINDQWSIGDPTYGIGLAYAFPVGNRAAKANWRQAELRVAQFQREFDKVVADVVLEVRNAGHNIEFTGNQREATRSVAVLANRELSLLQTRTELLVDGADVGVSTLRISLTLKIAWRPPSWALSNPVRTTLWLNSSCSVPRVLYFVRVRCLRRRQPSLFGPIGNSINRHTSWDCSLPAFTCMQPTANSAASFLGNAPQFR